MSRNDAMILPIANLPHPPKFLIPREDALDRVAQALAASQERVASVWIMGPPGAGKTAFAVAIAERLRNFDIRLFIRADNKYAIETSLREAGELLGLGKTSLGRIEPSSVIERLETSRDSWLLVYDGVKNEKDLSGLYPTSGRGAIVLTGRIRPHSFDPDLVFELGTIDKSEAAKLLQDWTGITDQPNAVAVANYFHDSTLALNLAASFINSSRMRSLDGYVEQLEQAQPTGAQPSRETALVTAVIMARDKVKSERPEAIYLLEILSFLAPTPFPTSILESGSLDIAGPSNVGDLHASLRMLSSYGLINLGQDDLLIHPAIGEIVRGHLSQKEVEARITAVITIVGNAINQASGNLATLLFPHAYYVARSAIDQQIDVDNALYLMAVAAVEQSATGYSDGVQELSKAIDRLSNQRGKLGGAFPDSLEALAIGLYYQGQIGEANERLSEALAQDRQLRGDEDPNTLRTMGNLAIVRRSLGDVSSAQALTRQVLESQERVLGPDHPDTLQSRANLATLLRDLGQLAEARALTEQVLADQERVLGPDHLSTLTTMGNLAFLLRDTYVQTGDVHDLQRARDEMEEVFQLQRRVLGKDHPATLTTMSSLVDLRRMQGDTAGAAALGEELVQRQSRVFGNDHVATRRTRSRLDEARNSKTK
jgi:tetratricopeptide (TPR) repeat protein